MTDDLYREMTEDTDSVQLFISDIGPFSLLTREEEAALGRRISEGDTEARNALCNANYRLVVKLARNYTYTGLELEDLIQAGNLGLLKTAEKFDYTLGYKFSTYATTWILQSVRRFIADTGRAIRIPVHMQESAARLRREELSLIHELGRMPTSGEISERTGFSEEKIRTLRTSSQDIISLDEPVGDEDDSDLYEIIPDTEDTPEETAVQDSLRGEIEKALENLSSREREVVRLRFGLDDGIIHTLEDIAGRYDVTRERVRQIEALALRKLRMTGENSLKEYWAA